MPDQIIPGAEPYSFEGGPNAVLVCHGFTGSPHSVRGLGEVFAAAGFTVEVPLWPGHGTSLDDMLATTWDDWCSAAEVAYSELASRCERVVVAGLSMGGTLACWLAASHPEIVGLVLVNPHVEPVAESYKDMIRTSLEQGITVAPAIGSDIADPEVRELAYDGSPLAPALSLFDAVDDLAARLADIRCPVLLFTSRQDHVVPPTSSDLLASSVSGPVERVMLERSYHVATLDYERSEIETRAVDFALKVTAG